jgi:hypothetical protein
MLFNGLLFGGRLLCGLLLESIDKYSGSARRVEETGRGNSVVAQFGSKN